MRFPFSSTKRKGTCPKRTTKSPLRPRGGNRVLGVLGDKEARQCRPGFPPKDGYVPWSPCALTARRHARVFLWRAPACCRRSTDAFGFNHPRAAMPAIGLPQWRRKMHARRIGAVAAMDTVPPWCPARAAPLPTTAGTIRAPHDAAPATPLIANDEPVRDPSREQRLARPRRSAATLCGSRLGNQLKISRLRKEKAMKVGATVNSTNDCHTSVRLIGG